MTPDDTVNYVMTTAMRSRHNYMMNKPYHHNIKVDIFISHALWHDMNHSEMFRRYNHNAVGKYDDCAAMIDGCKIHIVSSGGPSFLHISVTGGDV